jgi:hypothetical protein
VKTLAQMYCYTVFERGGHVYTLISKTETSATVQDEDCRLVNMPLDAVGTVKRVPDGVIAGPVPQAARS